MKHDPLRTSLPDGVKGHIELILGPMFSGKSSELGRRMRRYAIADRSCLMISYAPDDRYGGAEKVVTHDQTAFDAYPCRTLTEIPKDLINATDCIGIDEGQFFPDVVAFAEKMAQNGKIVIIAALDGTFERKPFNDILMLVPLSEFVTKLRAVCMVCYRDAAFSARRDLSNKLVEDIGGPEKYLAVCRACFELHGINAD